jgi:hypothetical protein
MAVSDITTVSCFGDTRRKKKEQRKNRVAGLTLPDVQKPEGN